MSKFDLIVKRIMFLSTVVATGSALALWALSRKEIYFAWLTAEMVPRLGIPFLVLFLLSCIFGGYGVVLIILEKYKDVKGLIDDIKKLKESKENE